jgi:hypothetical protein
MGVREGGWQRDDVCGAKEERRSKGQTVHRDRWCMGQGSSLIARLKPTGNKFYGGSDGVSGSVGGMASEEFLVVRQC